ncbi:hypothetical protein T03_10836 [Trichinella britovi]|uniref:Uncharacterized protein n=1 Tax=Trichinella britovi TaxID=45882 RepID=A0A0V1CXG2_TRIBR|nr:hypothetical protein T03_10836 [Trichinella britovi]
MVSDSYYNAITNSERRALALYITAGSQSGSRHFNVSQLANGYDLNIGAKMQTQVAFILLTPRGGG